MLPSLTEILSLLDRAGVDYGDVRIVRRREEHMSVKNGSLEGWSDEETAGFGVRVLAGGAWGFAASLDLSPTAARRTVDAAVHRALAAGGYGGRVTELAPVEIRRDDVTFGPREDPFSVSAQTKIDHLIAAAEALRADHVRIRTATYGTVEEEKVFGSTEGALLQQSRTYSGGGMAATAIRDGDVQVRSYPAAHGGHWRQGGFEVIRAMELEENAPAVAEEAARLLDAEPCPAANTTLILDADQTALQVHESIGHPTELDRVLGSETSYAGTSFIRPDDIGSLRYGSDIVNVTADATTPGGLGTFGYDDEGVPARRVDLIAEGMLRCFQTSRETASRAGQAEATGAMRASSWNRMPLIRMTNINLLPQNGSLEELISEVDDGVLMATNKSWSIDDRRLNFHFATEAGWRIEKGKRTALLRDCSYSGSTPAFWASCRRICGPEEVVLVGLTNCGKGQPGQSMSVSHATPPALFADVDVRPA